MKSEQLKISRINPREFCADSECLYLPLWMIYPFNFEEFTVATDGVRILFSQKSERFYEIQNFNPKRAHKLRECIKQCKEMTGTQLPPAYELEHECRSMRGQDLLAIKVDGVWLDKEFINILHTSPSPVEVFGFEDEQKIGFRTGDQFGIIMGLRARNNSTPAHRALPDAIAARDLLIAIAEGRV